MYREILTLETAFNELLPVRKLNAAPGKALLEAAAAWSEKIREFSNHCGPAELTVGQISEGSRLARRPLFLCGVHRSGTTLLRDLLDGHPALTVLPSEGSFLTNFAAQLRVMPVAEREAFLLTRWLRRLANPINQPPYWSLGKSTATSSPYLDFARAFSAWHRFAEQHFSSIPIWPHFALMLAYATCSRRPDGGLTASYWVDKTPTMEKYTASLWRQLPEAKFIQMVRSPQAVLLSRKHMEPGLHLRTCLRDMKLSYQAAIEQPVQHKDRYLVVHYESLCSNPISEMARITRFLGIDPHPSLLIPTVAGEPAHTNSSFNVDLPAGTILDIPRSRETGLSPHEEEILSAFLSGPATALGYPLRPLERTGALLTKLRFELEQRLFKKISAALRSSENGRMAEPGPVHHNPS